MKKCYIFLTFLLMQTFFCLQGSCDIRGINVSEECRRQVEGKKSEIASTNYENQQHESVLNKLYALGYKLASDELTRILDENPAFFAHDSEKNQFCQRLTEAIYFEIRFL
ncbi:hypothetical protein KBB68_03540 [Candidatus Babeliales bacterium]|nr:hypothetical protein [Candidatus Babeliales bacterium]